jgi:hypothetical protein
MALASMMPTWPPFSIRTRKQPMDEYDIQAALDSADATIQWLDARQQQREANEAKAAIRKSATDIIYSQPIDGLKRLPPPTPREKPMTQPTNPMSPEVQAAWDDWCLAHIKREIETFMEGYTKMISEEVAELFDKSYKDTRDALQSLRDDLIKANRAAVADVEEAMRRRVNSALQQHNASSRPVVNIKPKKVVQ